MNRGTTQGRPSLTCPDCHQTISRPRLEEHLEARLLDERGDEPVIEACAVPPSEDEAALREVEAEIRQATDEMREDGADIASLAERLVALKGVRTGLRTAPVVAPDDFPWEFSGRTVREAWADALDDHEARRAVLVGQLAGGTFRVVRGKVGRYLDPARVVVEWSDGFPTVTTV